MDPIHLEDAETRHPELFNILGSADVLVVIKSQERVDEETLKKLQEGVKGLLTDIDSRRGNNIAIVVDLPRPKGTIQRALHS